MCSSWIPCVPFCFVDLVYLIFSPFIDLRAGNNKQWKKCFQRRSDEMVDCLPTNASIEINITEIKWIKSIV